MPWEGSGLFDGLSGFGWLSRPGRSPGLDRPLEDAGLRRSAEVE